MWEQQNQFLDIHKNKKQMLNQPNYKPGSMDKNVKNKNKKDGIVRDSDIILQQAIKTTKKSYSSYKQLLQRKKQLEKQLIAIDNQIKNSHLVFSKGKKTPNYLKNSNLQVLQQEQSKKMDIIKKINKWTKQRQQTQRKKAYDQLMRQRKQKSLQQKRKKEEQQHEAFIKLEKRKKIQNNIKLIEQRQQIRIKEHSSLPQISKSVTTIPKYRKEQNNYIDKDQKIADEKINKKKKDMLKMLNPQQIKQHQKAYIDRIKDSLNMKSTKIDGKDKPKSQFNLYLNRKQQKVLQQLSKVKRRMNFQQKIMRIAINVDEKKKLQREISKDKSQFPHKYNFLSQKALNDEQIFREFKDFQIKTDPKKIGNEYLRKLKNQQKQIRPSKSQIINNDKLSYTQLQAKAKLRKKLNIQEFQQPLHLANKDKKITKKMLSKPIVYQTSTLKQNKYASVDRYENSVKKQRKIDNAYIKSINARLSNQLA